MDSEPGYVGLADDGAGKQVRNLTVSVLQPDGSTVTAYMQVVAIADEEGRLLDLGGLESLAARLDRTNELLELLLGAIEP